MATSIWWASKMATGPLKLQTTNLKTLYVPPFQILHPPSSNEILTKQLQDYISQDTLSTMIRKDETRGRRRFYDYLSTYNDTAGKLTYPPDYMPVGKVIRNLYGVRSGVAAVFMLHAVANGNPMVCCYLFF